MGTVYKTLKPLKFQRFRAIKGFLLCKQGSFGLHNTHPLQGRTFVPGRRLPLQPHSKRKKPILEGESIDRAVGGDGIR